MKRILFWVKALRKDSYRSLWYEVYGGRDEGDKGLRRWRAFDISVWGSWKNAYDNERNLRRECELALKEAGLEAPYMKRNREVLERLGVK